MGPRLVERGKGLDLLERVHGRLGFNGAALG